MDQSIECHELFVQLGDEQVLVIDCRDEAEWGRYDLQIPGALRMGFSELSAHAHILPDDELIVLCGTAHDDADARRAARLLGMRGRMAVWLTGGLRGWISRGYPTERSAPPSLAAYQGR